jgi:NAD(P)-dependent dehydrogenase (short-subunit alcohol dehydrogenase family)
VQQGAKVKFVDLDAKASALLSSNLNSNAAFEIYDIRDIDALKTAFENLQAKLGAAIVLVNNAARDDRHAWQDVTPEYWGERFATNLRHMFFAMQALAPGMIEAGGGSIIDLSSNSWWEAVGGFPAYATAKAAVHGLTRTMARDLGQHRIRVNTVVPGWIMTERQKTLWATP